MADCSTAGHLFGANDRCLHCGDPAPQIPEFLRRAREPAASEGLPGQLLHAELVSLRAFKAYVHARLDAAGVPTHPDGEHSKAGCRIGDRLDIVVAALEEGAIHATAWRTLGYLLGKFPELSGVIVDELRLLEVLGEQL